MPSENVPADILVGSAQLFILVSLAWSWRAHRRERQQRNDLKATET